MRVVADCSESGPFVKGEHIRKSARYSMQTASCRVAHSVYSGRCSEAPFEAWFFRIYSTLLLMDTVPASFCPNTFIRTCHSYKPKLVDVRALVPGNSSCGLSEVTRGWFGRVDRVYYY